MKVDRLEDGKVRFWLNMEEWILLQESINPVERISWAQEMEYDNVFLDYPRCKFLALLDHDPATS